MVLPIPILGALIGGGASLLGGMMQNSAAQNAAAKQMEFQKEMSDTSYQRAMEDMRKAGLNPILAYKQGGAAVTPGSTYVPSNIGAAAAEGASKGVSSAVQAQQAQSQIEAIQAQTASNLESVNTQKAQQAQSIAQAGLASAQRVQALEGALNTAAQTHILNLDVASARARAQVGQTDEEFYKTPFGQFLRNIDRIGTSINPMTSATSNIGR